MKNRYSQILEAAKTALRGIEKHGGDLERFIESEGMILERVDSLPHGVATIYGEMIIVVKNENPSVEKLRILHELGHVFLHSMCIGFYQMDDFIVKKKEREAQTFASLILFPTIDNFETEQDFIQQSGLPPKTARLRINFFRRTGI